MRVGIAAFWYIAIGEYGKEARYMSYDLAEAAIRDSALEFLKCLDGLGSEC